MKRKILLLCLWILLLLCAIEMTIAKLLPQRTYYSFGGINGCFMKDPTVYVLHRPNARCTNKSEEFSVTMHMDADGFRRTTQTNRPQNPSILVLGDSFTFGHGVKDEEAYPAVLESSLRSKGISARVLNAGISGVGLDWYYLFLKERARQYNPSAILVGVFLGNDMFDHMYFDTTVRDSNGLPITLLTSAEYVLSDGTRNYTNTPFRYRIPFFRNSHLVQILATALGGHVNAEGLLTNGSPCFFQESCHEIDTHLSHTKILLQGMKKQADDMHIPLHIVLIPWEAQLPAKLILRSKGTVYAVNKKNRYRINSEILTYCDQLQLSCIDLLPAFEKYEGNSQVFFPKDTHWNATGHEIAGEYLASKLEAILFPPIKMETE